MDVVALGELLIDFACVSADAEGYPTMAAHPGGAPANFLAALAKFGAKTALLGKIGTDAFGKLLTGTLDAALSQISRDCREEADRAIDRCLAVIEPVMVAVLSVLVGIMLLSVLVPMLGLLSVM